MLSLNGIARTQSQDGSFKPSCASLQQLESVPSGTQVKNDRVVIRFASASRLVAGCAPRSRIKTVRARAVSRNNPMRR